MLLLAGVSTVCATSAAQIAGRSSHSRPQHESLKGGAAPSTPRLDPERARPRKHQESGQVDLRKRKRPKSGQPLAPAIQAGASPEVHLFRAQHLIGENRPDEAGIEMQAYLGGRKLRSLPESIRMIYIGMQDRLELELEARGIRTIVDRTLPELLATSPELKGLEPAKSQDELPMLLRNVGRRVETSFRDFRDTTSLERIDHEFLDRHGKASLTRREQFHYLLLKWADASQPGIEEYRTQSGQTNNGEKSLPNLMITTEGFASESIHFLPAFRTDSRFVDLGRQRIDGHETRVIAFAQQPPVARLVGGFKIDSARPETLFLLQGIAWIDPRTYRIIRLRTELLNPVPKVRLEMLITEVNYAEVHFKPVSSSLWLPKKVVVTLKWKGRLLRNTHVYSHFRLFQVESNWIVLTSKVKSR